MTAPPNPYPRQGLVISDLHLFATRSDGATLFESLYPQLTSVQVLILNGDTFDFRWSELPNHPATVMAAVQWLGELLLRLPRCDIHLLLGNHDCLDEFTRCLPSLTETHSTFHWHDHWIRMGHSVFLHGDCVQYRMDATGLARYRAPWRADQQRSRVASKVYGWADRLKLTYLSHRLAFPRQRAVDRIAHYLDRACPDWRRKTRHCYFGHTHLPFSTQVYQGVSFHNTGSAIRGMAFNPCWFDCAGSPQPTTAPIACRGVRDRRASTPAH